MNVHRCPHCGAGFWCPQPLAGVEKIPAHLPAVDAIRTATPCRADRADRCPGSRVEVPAERPPSITEPAVVTTAAL